MAHDERVLLFFCFQDSKHMKKIGTNKQFLSYIDIYFFLFHYYLEMEMIMEKQKSAVKHTRRLWLRSTSLCWWDLVQNNAHLQKLIHFKKNSNSPFLSFARIHITTSFFFFFEAHLTLSLFHHVFISPCYFSLHFRSVSIPH